MHYHAFRAWLSGRTFRETPDLTVMTRRCAKAWFVKPSTRPFGRLSWPQRPLGRRASISTYTAGTFFIGICHRILSTSNSARAESIGETAWPFASPSRGTGRSPALGRKAGLRCRKGTLGRPYSTRSSAVTMCKSTSTVCFHIGSMSAARPGGYGPHSATRAILQHEP